MTRDRMSRPRRPAAAFVWRLFIISALSLILPAGCARLAAAKPATPKPADPPSGAWKPPAAASLKDEEIAILRKQSERYKTESMREKLERQIYLTQLQVAVLHGFGVKAVVRYAPMTPAVINRLIEDSVSKGSPGRSLAMQLWLAELLGALPRGFDMVREMKTLMGEQAAGVYDPDTKTFFVRMDFSADTAMGRMIFAHEIGHALQDQNFSLKKMGVDETGNSDHAMAGLAIAEGDATLLMMEHMLKYGSPISALADLPKMMAMDQGQFDRAPRFIQQSVLFPYMGGMHFFQTLNGRTRANPKGKRADPTVAVDPTDAAWRNGVFADPPETTEQILHPEKYLARELPAKIPVLRADGATTSTDDVLGEFGISQLLEPALGQADAARAAAGWNGDRMLIADDDARGRRTVDWLTRWDTPADAREFAEALEAVLVKRLPGGLRWQGEARERRAAIGGFEARLLRPQPDTVRLKLGARMNP